MNTLGTTNTAAAFLRAREAIVNLDYGEVSQNKKTVIAWADEKVLTPLRRKWWLQGARLSAPPYIFEKEQRASISTLMGESQSLKERALSPTAVVGEKISITGAALSFPLPNEMGRNVAIIGAPDEESNNAIGIMQSMSVSLAVQHPKGDARFLFCDFQGKDETVVARYPLYFSLMQELGFLVEDIPRKRFQEAINELVSNSSSAESSGKIYVFAAGLDKWEFEKDAYGTPPLRDFVSAAPGGGIHFTGWWVKPSNFKAQVSGYEGSDAFNTKLFLRVDERAIQALTNPYVQWSPMKNRGLASDEVELTDEVAFIPCAPISVEDINAINSKKCNQEGFHDVTGTRSNRGDY